jgi:hypothetical protein
VVSSFESSEKGHLVTSNKIPHQNVLIDVRTPTNVSVVDKKVKGFDTV